MHRFELPTLALCASILLGACGRPASPEAVCVPPTRAAERTEPPQQFIQTSHWAAVKNLAYSPDGRFVASYGADSAVRIWDAQQRHALRIFLVRRDITGLMWDGHDKLLVERQASLYREHGILLDVSQGEATATIGDHREVIAWRGQDRRERWVGHRGLALAIFDEQGNKRRTIPFPCRTYDNRHFAIAEGGAAIATTDCGQPFKTLRIFQRKATDDGYDEERLPLPDLDGFIRALRVSQDGRVVVIDAGKDDAQDDDPPLIVFYHGAAHSLEGKLGSPRHETLLSHDGSWIAARSHDRLMVWRSRDQKQMWSAPIPPATTIAFAPNGREIALGTQEGRILLFDVVSGRTMGELGYPVRRAETIRFENEDRLLVDTAQSTNEWSVAEGQLVERREKDKAPPAPSPDLSEAALAAKNVVPNATVVAAILGGSFLVGDVDGSLHVVRQGRIVATGKSDGLAISYIEVAPKGNIAATISLDGAVRIWDAKTATMRAMMYDFQDDEWLVATPRGAYTGTLEIGPRIGWVFDKPLEFFSANQYLDTFHRPDLVRRRLGGDPMDAEPNLIRPPQVDIVETPENTWITNEARISITLGPATSARTIRAYAEGRLVDTKPVCGDAQTMQLDVPLIRGVNRVSVVAFDDRGYASNPAWVDLIAKPALEHRPALWIVAVGVSKYPKFPADAQLDVADDDAEAMAATWSQLAGPDKPFAEAHVTSLLNERVSRKSVLDALTQLEGMAANDLAIVSFAGHGVKIAKDAEMMFLTPETGPKKADVLATGIGWTAMGDRLAKARGRVVVFLDACHSGHFSRDALVPNASLASALARGERAGVLVFAASKGRQFSYEMGGTRGAFDLEGTPTGMAPAAPKAITGHGMFTGSLLEALKSSSTDRNGDRALQLSEVLDDVARRVTDATEGKQTPWITRRELFGDFTLAPAAQ